jgi:hypothetical protein
LVSNENPFLRRKKNLTVEKFPQCCHGSSLAP